jgi:CHAD domain-containing protein
MLAATAQFEKNFDRSVARVKKRLDAYLRDPSDEENVHDMRTSLRRFEAAFSLLPKKARKRSRKWAEACKAFFRANSLVRDLDIIRAKIMALGGRQFVEAIEAKRRNALAHALALARTVESMLPAPGAKSIGKEELANRMDKVASRLVRAVKEHLPVVVMDSSKKEELHELRKDMKKLRYVLEILPASYRKRHGTAATQIIGGGNKGALARLKELQAILGSIRDCDITLDYLQEVKGAQIILQKEKVERDLLYKKFTETIS